MSHLGSLRTSPHVQFRQLPTNRRAVPKAGLQHQSPQSNSNANVQSQLVEYLQSFIRSELQACREALTAAQEDFMTNSMATLEARFDANNSWRNNSATNLGDLKKDVCKLQGSLKEMELRLGKVAVQQLSQHAEQQVFETQVVFESFEESLRALRQGTSSGELQLASISRAKTAERHKAVESALQGNGGQLRTLTERSSFAPHAATEKCKRVSPVIKLRQITSLSPECEQNQQASGSITPCSGVMMPETSFRIEALEVALASMQQQEQERICRLQERIRAMHGA